MRFWQEFDAGGACEQSTTGATYGALMPDGTRLTLPLRDLGERAVAGLIVNQASFAVLDRLTAWLAEVARRHAPDIVVGLPTLGHGLAAGVARALGHAHWAAPGTSRKLWYDEALSVPIASVTSPGPGRRMWLDPNLVERLAGRRVLVVDDVISTGASLRAGLALLARAGVRPVAACACMLQGDRWRADGVSSPPVEGVFATPLFARSGHGWSVIAGSQAAADCPLMPRR